MAVTEDLYKVNFSSNADKFNKDLDELGQAYQDLDLQIPKVTKDLQAQTKKLQSLNSNYDKATNKIEKLTLANETSAKQIEVQTLNQKAANLELEEAIQKYGKYSTEAQKAGIKVEYASVQIEHQYQAIRKNNIAIEEATQDQAKFRAEQIKTSNIIEQGIASRQKEVDAMRKQKVEMDKLNQATKDQVNEQMKMNSGLKQNLTNILNVSKAWFSYNDNLDKTKTSQAQFENQMDSLRAKMDLQVKKIQQLTLEYGKDSAQVKLAEAEYQRYALQLEKTNAKLEKAKEGQQQYRVEIDKSKKVQEELHIEEQRIQADMDLTEQKIIKAIAAKGKDSAEVRKLTAEYDKWRLALEKTADKIDAEDEAQKKLRASRREATLEATKATNSENKLTQAFIKGQQANIKVRDSIEKVNNVYESVAPHIEKATSAIGKWTSKAGIGGTETQKLEQRIKALSAIEKQSPGITGKMERAHAKLITTFQKEAREANKLAQAEKKTGDAGKEMSSGTSLATDSLMDAAGVAPELSLAVGEIGAAWVALPAAVGTAAASITGELLQMGGEYQQSQLVFHRVFGDMNDDVNSTFNTINELSVVGQKSFQDVTTAAKRQADQLGLNDKASTDYALAQTKLNSAIELTNSGGRDFNEVSQIMQNALRGEAEEAENLGFSLGQTSMGTYVEQQNKMGNVTTDTFTKMDTQEQGVWRLYAAISQYAKANGIAVGSVYDQKTAQEALNKIYKESEDDMNLMHRLYLEWNKTNKQMISNLTDLGLALGGVIVFIGEVTQKIALVITYVVKWITDTIKLIWNLDATQKAIKAVVDFIKRMITAVQNVIKQVSKWAKENHVLEKALDLLKRVLNLILTPISKMIQWVVKAIDKFQEWVKETGLVGKAIRTLEKAITILERTLDKVVGFIERFVDALKAIPGKINAIIHPVSIWNEQMDILKSVLKENWDNMTGWTKVLGDSVSPVNAVKDVTNLLKETYGMLKTAVIDVKAAIVELVTGMVDYVKAVLTAWQNSEGFQLLLNLLRETVSLVVTSFLAAVHILMDWVTTVIDAVTNSKVLHEILSLLKDVVILLLSPLYLAAKAIMYFAQGTKQGADDASTLGDMIVNLLVKGFELLNKAVNATLRFFINLMIAAQGVFVFLGKVNNIIMGVLLMAFQYLDKKVGEVVETFRKFVDMIVNKVLSSLDWMAQHSEALAVVIGVLALAFAPLILEFVAVQVAALLAATGTAIFAAGGTALGLVISGLTMVIGGLTTAFLTFNLTLSAGYEALKRFGTGLLSGAKKLGSSLKSGLSSLGTSFANAWGSNVAGWSKWSSSVKSAIQPAVDGVKKSVDDMSKAVKDSGDKISKFADNITKKNIKMAISNTLNGVSAFFAAAGTTAMGVAAEGASVGMDVATGSAVALEGALLPVAVVPILISLAIAALVVALYFLIKNFDKVKAYFQKLVASVKKWWQDFVANLPANIQNMIVQLISNLILLIPAVLMVLTTLLHLIGSLLLRAAAWLATKAIILGLKILEGIVNLGAKIVQAIIIVFTTIGGVIAAALYTVFSIAGTIITIALQTIAQLFITWGQLIWTYFSMLFEILNTIVQAGWEIIKTTFTTALQIILDTVTNFFTMIKNIITDIWNSIVTFFTNIWEHIKQIFSGVLEIIHGIVTLNMGEIKDGIHEVMTGIQGIFGDIWGLITDLFHSVLDNIKQFMIDEWTSIKQDVSDWWNKIKDTISQAWDKIKTVVHDKMEEMKKQITEGWDNIKQNASDKWESIKGTISGKWDKIKSDAGSHLQSIHDTCSTGWEKVKSTTKTKWDTMSKNWFKTNEDMSKGNSKFLGKMGIDIQRETDKFKHTWETAGNNIRDTWNKVMDFIYDHTIGKLKDMQKAFSDWAGSIGDSITAGLNHIPGVHIGGKATHNVNVTHSLDTLAAQQQQRAITNQTIQITNNVSTSRSQAATMRESRLLSSQRGVTW